MMSTSLALLGVQRRLAHLVVVAHLLGVAGGRNLGSRRIDVEILPAQRFDLVGDLGPRIGGQHDGTQTACGADGGQSGHTRADHQHLGRRHLARRGHLPGEEPTEGMRRLDHGAITRDVRHRRQHVQRLRPGDARHRIHGQRRDRAGGQLLDEVRVQSWRHEADQCRAVTKCGDLFAVRCVHLEHHIGFQDLIRRSDVGAGLGERSVGETRRGAGTRLDQHRVAELDQLPDCLGGGGNPCLTVKRLSWYPDDHRFRSDLVSSGLWFRSCPPVRSCLTADGCGDASVRVGPGNLRALLSAAHWSVSAWR